MGLGVSGVSHLRYARPMPGDEEFDRLYEAFDAEGKDLFEVYFMLDANDTSHKAQLKGMKPGLYEYTERSEKHGFSAGSYSYYNGWRRRLCQFAHGVDPEEVWNNPRRHRGKPFVELIDFSDCDGRIGTQVSAKLARDFRDHHKRAADYATTIENGSDWFELYQDFARAFELAAQDGVVRFA
jgi:hypothetical protein